MNQFEKDMVKRMLVAQGIKWGIIIGAVKLAQRAARKMEQS
jgi:hypothetical protein